MVVAHGSDDSFARDIPIRVSHLESSVQELHQDNQRSQRTLAGVVAQLEAQGRLLTDISNKLDAARTKKPELSTVASFLAVLITISVLAFAPVYREMTTAAGERKDFAERLLDRAYELGQTSARLDQDEDAIRQINNRLLKAESDRFTKQDAQWLEDKLRQEMKQ